MTRPDHWREFDTQPRRPRLRGMAWVALPITAALLAAAAWGFYAACH